MDNGVNAPSRVRELVIETGAAIVSEKEAIIRRQLIRTKRIAPQLL